MWWRVSAAAFGAQKGQPNQDQFRAIVEAGDVPGILAYRGATPVGWCAVAPRERFPRLLRSRLAFDRSTAGVWSVVCLFVARGSRRRGVSAALLDAAVAHARERGAQIVEGYPVEPRTGTVPDAFAWTGLPAAFRRAGFVEVARGAPTRPVMRFDLRPR
jgi:GNAT superfamily N-acetyltransferase